MTIENFEQALSKSYILIASSARGGTISHSTIRVKELDFVIENVPSLQQGTKVQISIDKLRDLGASFDKEKTLSVEIFNTSGDIIYRDIVVFEGRLDSNSDYTQNEGDDSGYVFG